MRRVTRDPRFAAALSTLTLAPAASALAAGGTWTDTTYYYEWVLTKRHHHTLTGYVDFGGVPCTARTWPVTGTFNKKDVYRNSDESGKRRLREFLDLHDDNRMMDMLQA
jgi:hypothetical protein